MFQVLFRMQLKRTFFLKAVLLFLGASLFFWLIQLAGIQRLLDTFYEIGWPLFLIFIPYFIVYLLDALGWQSTFNLRPKRLGFYRLFLIRTAGESLNNTLPSASLGGEPVKALLLKRFNVDMAEASSSVIVAKTTMTIAQALFTLLGFGALYISLEHSIALSGFFPVAWIVFIVGVIGLGVLVRLQQTGFTRPLVRVVGVSKLFTQILARYEKTLVALDVNLARFHSQAKAKFWVSSGWFFCGWMVGVFEVYFFGVIFGVPLSLIDALAIEALVTMLRTVAFLMPGNIGIQEGGIVLLFLAVGQTTFSGISFSLVRRLRELIWIGFGFGLLSWYGWKNQEISDNLEK